ncbi:hypothetical protein AUEXF2481DRAFT_29111 [Aureobasidium subglaciale EXF-2481]|uniref:DNA mismatch repair protein S5 domain-containing protein n=1 Tax=Aureobasidium subglaciale (strain EXF-2481) TaxID=1043005 RepID=A0A074YD20_AURSE|nr:uncharacterized protein AUEXF2481DRAFT_29111 [Aureobasidium subglaciale EXF-2481]KAI5199362.1 hypothetical protein E4T38_07066 [Aureobasidium subglaciale]KAI5218205.1 hypothetical protein E4T40_06997 [Aureobasidium subglaciale]KAI5221739.1 hypothetical protein E4T41_06917 [Aureobasidium subglaciale]KAI5259160.1 hypothetical protein E4T46_06895 [Aureobasidium subglaciale]KEQ95683.1 hypothetical protein AUEXF2481DRAFT_29111 [Aureobasidium subglaciale EXF-2481]
MSIHALPQAAVRTIRSGQALTDPTSVVKELVDNALDARASNITVEISTNTLDLIQVKDNGHGIAPTDRPLVAKPYCTSKLKDEKDLALVGSFYLGFRGEALSSALEMSGEMTITTRVEGESIATAIKLDQNGEPVQDRATHPPGTTIRIVNFLKNQPVRKQVALKVAPKTLTRIKQLLQSYAFARPATRLSLKVIKAKSDKDNWTYAPKVGSGIEDTALKVVGKPCAAQCVWAEMEHEGFTVQAFLPRPDAHASKISGLGQYVSVNDRPLTSSRGISRQLVRIYKESLKGSSSLHDAKDPFLYLSLSCPPGSYDVNIEPAKDDVLFGDVDKVTEAVRRLMLISYPEKDDVVEPTIALKPAQVYRVPETETRPKRAEAKDNMYDLDEDDLTLFMDSVEQPRLDAVEEEERPGTLRSAAMSNPWVTAKMNAYSNKKTAPNVQLLTPAKPASSATLESSSPAFEIHHSQQYAPGLPTPRPSSPVSMLTEEVEPSGHHRMIGPPDLPPPIPHMSSQSKSPIRNSFEASGSSSAPHRMTLPPDQAPEGTPLDSIPEVALRRRSPAKQQQRSFANKPFVSPVDPERDAWFHFPESQRSKQFAPKRMLQRQSVEGLVPNEEPYSSGATPTPNNADIRNFLGRGRDQQSATPVPNCPTDSGDESALQTEIRHETQPKGFVKASELDLESTKFVEAVHSAPKAKPKRHRTADDRALEEISGNGRADDEGASGSEYEDRPRRRRTGESDPKRLRRTKSATLPLEKVPVESQTQSWNTMLAVTVDGLDEQLRHIVSEGTFMAWNAPAFDPLAEQKRSFTEDDVQLWTSLLSQSLLRLEPEAELVRDLVDVVRNSMSRWESFAV